MDVCGSRGWQALDSPGAAQQTVKESDGEARVTRSWNMTAKP